MIRTLQQILERAVERLADTSMTYLPPLLAGLVILLVAYLIARMVRWMFNRMIKASGVDRFLLQSGISSMLDRSGRLHAAQLVAQTAYWMVILIGVLTALNAFNTELTTRIISSVVLLLPKLVTAALILVAGVWLGKYLGRSMLVWAHNEEMPWPRKLAAVVRTGIIFVSIVVAADHLDFARGVFLAAFVLLMGGAVVSLSIALGMSTHYAIKRRLEEERPRAEEMEEKSLWNHL
ncbi:MAG: hypothetical protein WD696_18980 [Bryobacteraceae bacterium]